MKIPKMLSSEFNCACGMKRSNVVLKKVRLYLNNEPSINAHVPQRWEVRGNFRLKTFYTCTRIGGFDVPEYVEVSQLVNGDSLLVNVFSRRWQPTNKPYVEFTGIQL